MTKIYNLEPNLYNFYTLVHLVQSWGSRLTQIQGLSRNFEEEWWTLFQKIDPFLTEFKELIHKRIQFNIENGNQLQPPKEIYYKEEKE